MKVCYELCGDKKYAYRVTSKREPGKKYPTTIKEHLGVVDPDTGDLIPKKTRSDDVKFTLATGTYKIIDDGGLRIRTERTKRVREILELFGVEDPKQLPLSIQA